jgi:tRNA pseudouridine55 synthase
MGRRNRKGDPVHGWFIVDKPEGVTSTRTVAILKRLSNAQKAGHGGTLDPLATGILPIAMGEATKTLPYVVDNTKEYEFTVRWGVSTSTDDREGEVVETSENRPDRAMIECAIPSFMGVIEQVPPAFSAIKVAGKRAYDLARKGEEVVLAAREIKIHDLSLVEIINDDHAVFRVVSGAGAYMRSLARDLSVALGTVGHLIKLRRTRVGPFSLDTSISLDELQGFGHIAAVLECLLPIETALDDIPALALTGTEANQLRHGQSVSLLRKGDLERVATLGEGDTVLATDRGKPVALTEYYAGEVRPFRVLNL